MRDEATTNPKRNVPSSSNLSCSTDCPYREAPVVCRKPFIRLEKCSMSHCRYAFPYFVVFLFLTLFAAPSFAGVSVSSPANGATVGTSVHYVATASSSCAKGVSGVGIYTADDRL